MIGVNHLLCIKRQKAFWICLIGLLAFSMIFPMENPSTKMTYKGTIHNDIITIISSYGIAPDDSIMVLVEKAWEIAQPNSNLILKQVHMQVDEKSGSQILHFDWSSKENHMILVEIDVETQNLINYVDTRRHSAYVENQKVGISKSMAVSDALHFVEKYSSIPTDAVLESVEDNQFGMIVKWNHVVDGILVRDDFIQVQVNSMSGAITGFSFRWNEVSENRRICVDALESIRIIRANHFNQSVSHEILPSLEWISVNCEKHKLAWHISSDIAEYWVSTETGEIVHRDPYLIYYEAQAIMQDYAEGTSEGIGAGYKAWEYVCGVLRNHFDNVGERNPPLTESAWKSAVCSYVAFSVGHGSFDTTYNYIKIDVNTNRVYPYEIYEAPSRYLTYLLHCFSGSIITTQTNSLGYQFVWKSRSISMGDEVFYANAFVGFDDSMPGSYSSEFTIKFWEALDWGYSVNAARSYASTLYPSVGTHCRIYGDLGITIEG